MKLDEIKKFIKSCPLKQRNELLNLTMEHLFCAITEDHMVYDKLTKEQKEKFRVEANNIISSELWQWLTIEMEEVCRKKLFNEAISSDDLIVGKAMLYTIDIIKNKLKNLGKI